MTKELYIEGESIFCSPNKLDKWGNYSLRLYVDQKDLHKLMNSGTQLKIQTDEKGASVTFRRVPAYRTLKGIMVELGPVPVYDKDGDETDVFIQPGDRVVAKITLYGTQKGVGTRLEAIILPDQKGKYVDLGADEAYTGIRV